MSLQYWLDNYILDPKNQEVIFNLGWEYEKIGQTASAAGYYLRSVEFGKDNDKIYEALLRMSICFEKQTNRTFTIKGVLLRAISLLPKRPEAYFLLARIYERNKDWQEGYTISELGMQFATDKPNTHTDVEYPGDYGLPFEKAICGWWIGLCDETIASLRYINQNYNLAPAYKTAIENNLRNLGNSWKEPMTYTQDQFKQLKYKFPGAESIERNFSQCYQDLFVLSMLNGKRDGTYLEIGSADPFYGNNTALLETHFNWKGQSIDINPISVSDFRNRRLNQVIEGDATNINYESLLTEPIIDYLQVDCDPPSISYETLLQIPFWKHKFRVITFEHDAYVDDTKSIREKSRKYLESYGYKLVVANVSPDAYSPYEDWWVHPELVDVHLIEIMQSIGNETKKADIHMLIA